MEILLLGIYAAFVWVIFFKFKLLPWNTTSKVIVVTLPIVALTWLILYLNIVAPSSHDIRVVNYVVPINPPVRGLVTEVPVEPNRPIKKGDVLFKIDPTLYEIAVKNYQAQLAQLKVQLVTAEANTRNLQETLKGATGQKDAINSQLTLARLRLKQFKELADSGAGNKFDYEKAQADVQNLEGQLASVVASEAQAREKLGAKTPDGEQDEIANVKAQIARADAQLADAKWELSQTTYYAPANGTVVSVNLRPGAMAVPLPMSPAMNFVEEDQWILAIYHQNEVRKIKPGQEAEVAFEMYPGQIVKCKVDSIIWATAQGQLPIGTLNVAGGVAPIPPNCLAVRLLTDARDKDIFLAAGAHGAGAVYTDAGKPIQILRRVLVRVNTKLNWLILKMH
jgi:multidrug resistance efflux pump